MKKQEVYVEVRTKKQAKKLKEVLDMFGEKLDDITSKDLETFEVGWLNNNDRTPALIYKDGEFIGAWVEEHRDKAKVSIKQLRNILASEHLKEGDIVVCENDGDIAVGVFEEWEPKFGFELSDYIYLLDEYKSVGGCFINFVRYATDEEKNLLKTELTPDDYKDLTWYKSTVSGGLFFLDKNKDTPNYGLYKGVVWGEGFNWFKNFNENYFHEKGRWFEATYEEVEQVLTQEAKRRGYKVGNSKCLYDGAIWDFDSGQGYRYIEKDNELILDSSVVFKNGEWAEIIQETPEQKVVKYAESVDWDFDKVNNYLKKEMVFEDFKQIEGLFSDDKTRYIFNKYNPHWEVKKSFKEGKEVEYRSNINGQWRRATTPTWSDFLEYRVKPEDSSEVVNDSDKIINDWVEELKTIQKEVKSNTLNRTDIISKGIGIYIPLVWVRLY